MDDLIGEFLTETNESLALLDTELVRLEQEPNNHEVLSSIFRLMHTIKGTCGFLGLPRLEKVAHAGENILGKFRDGELAVTAEAVTLILRCIDAIRELLAALEATGHEPDGDDSLLIAALNQMANGEFVQSPASSAMVAADVTDTADVSPVFADDGFPVAAELLAEVEAALSQTGVKPAPAAPPSPPAQSGAVAPPRSAAEEPRDPASAAATIRVQVGVIENLMTLISELVLTRNQLLQTQRVQGSSEFKVPLQRLSHITSDLQEGVTKMRMQPIGNAWNKLPRIVRDLSVDSGKRIELVTKGADTELDRQVLEMIKDPLTHMVRNAADHGIEMPAQRRQNGKSESGTITLEAYHEGGHIVIRIADDGKGLDVPRIREKILAKGLATEGELAAMSEQQVLHFIFRPGFSTAEQVTAVSGRGVGMDVVRTNIERIGGTIELSSVSGLGTTFLIKIPLTLAIVSALIVEVCGERFALPQIHVMELVRAGGRSTSRIEKVKEAAVLRLRDSLLPLVSLRDLLQLEKVRPNVDQFVVVTQVGAQNFGLIVDRVYDAEEIVVKPVAPILRGTSYYAGNTILGDGSVIMILDANGIASNINCGDLNDQRDTSNAVKDRADTKAAFLLFSAKKRERKAVPLELVARIEEIEVPSIEEIGGRRVVQYRDRLMPLVPFSTDFGWPERGRVPVIVFSDGARSMGLVVEHIIDVVDDRMSVELKAGQSGLIGSAIIAGNAVDIIDVGYFLRQAYDDWFSGGKANELVTVERQALLVDDSAFFRNLVAPLLRAAQLRVTMAADGAEALRLLEAGEHFDLIVSDIEMPQVDGLAMASEIKRDPRFQDTPMIALSSHVSEADKAAGRAAGFQHYISKADQANLAANLNVAVGASIHQLDNGRRAL